MTTLRNARVLRIITLMFIVLLCPVAYGKVIYVDNNATGANDGTSWTNAYVYLQDALADANSADKPVEIRVAQGIYKPDQGADVPYPPTWPANLDYRATFNLINGVTIKGGYAGFAEQDPNFRDIELYKTILSGDLNGDDVDVNDPGDLFDAPKRGDNRSNVLTGSNTDATAVLDGFTISGGAIWVIPFRRIIGGSPAGGAGMLIFSGNPTLINCTFTDNVTGNSGGGLLLYDNSNPTLTNCTFTRNYAESGGGIFSSGSSPTLIDCMFDNNYV
jgi:parallel beta-helix repeat protein